MTFAHFIQGLVGIGTGFLILRYREQLRDLLGNVAFAEKLFGVGGTWTFLNVLGFLDIILSIMWMFGVFQRFLDEYIARFFI